MQPSIHIDDFGPLPLFRPSSVNEVSNLVQHAASEGQAVYPIGGRTMLDLGLPPTKPGIAIDLTGLDQVIDYPARDMTITVQAGITISKLQALLAAENQRLPIDVPDPDHATLGGAIATNASGPRRYGHGTLRDYLIGITVVNDEGQEVKAGGRVVKNVAGYDMCKLYTGSLGTLGIITQVTLKVRPLPEEQTLVALGCPVPVLDQLLDLLHGSQTRPVCVELLNAEAIRNLSERPKLPDTPWVVLLGIEGNREAVRWQIQQVEREFESAVAHRDVQMHAIADPEGLERQLTDFSARPSGLLTFKASLLPSATAKFSRRAGTVAEPSLIQGHAGNGIVIGHLGGDLTLDQVKPILTTLHEAAGAEGNVVLLRCPPAWKRELPVWGRPRGDAGLMRTVKEKLDPRRLFNPGRFLDGI